MSANPYSREFTRVPIVIWGTFADESGEKLTGEVNNLSLRGCHVSTFDGLPEDGRYTLTLFTGDEDGALRFEVLARIVRSDSDGMGVEFVELPLDSYEHLRHLVRLNTNDPEKVEREIREHLGIRRAA